LKNANRKAVPLDVTKLSRIFKILGDETRILILWDLFQNGESNVSDLAAKLNISASTLSHQLRTLRQEKLVKKRRIGKNIYYNLDDEHVASIIHYAIVHTNNNTNGGFFMKKTFKLLGLDCANCAAKIENAVQKIPGITSASVNFMTTKMVLEAEDDKMEDIISQATAIVKKLEPGVEIKKA